MGQLRTRMQTAMKLRNFSPRTQDAYLGAVTGLAKFYNRAPDLITSEEVQSYLLYLLEDRGLSWSSCNQAISGFRFLYTQTLGKKSTSFFIPPRKREVRLPEIFSSRELGRLFFSASTFSHRVLLMTTYAAGLRVSEVVRLRVSDLDSDRKLIRVEQGKGNKDRYTLLTIRLLEELRNYWRAVRPKTWLFSGKHLKGGPMPIGTAQKIYYQAKANAGLRKGKGIHTIRHCFATHLLEAGWDLRTIQTLMGHTSILTTMVYLQVTRKRLDSLQNPFDLLDFSPKDKSPQGS